PRRAGSRAGRAPPTPRAAGATCARRSPPELEFVLILAVVAVVVWVITGPLRNTGRAHDEALEAERAELEAERDAKYREIRDAELDYRTGKLSEADWRVQD